MASNDKVYDVAIVGAGVSGALIAHNLAKNGISVVVLEAGQEMRHPEDFVERFYAADTKVPDTPWPTSDYANRPSVLDLGTADAIKNSKYLMQSGYVPFNSNYERIGGGTGNHWLGTALRHVPRDFKLKSNFYNSSHIGNDGKPLLEHARDWPIDYGDLESWYDKAEYEVGVSGNSELWNGFLGAERSRDYPMPEIAPTYLDQKLGEAIDGLEVNAGIGLSDTKTIRVMNTPQARNSVDYDKRYRCLGNTSCIPICPIQAKYDPTVSLTRAQRVEGTPAEVLYKHVAYQVEIGDDDQVSGIKYTDYSELQHPPAGNAEPDDVLGRKGTIKAKLYVLCAHAVETPKLLLNSPWKTKNVNGVERPVTAANSSDQVGRNLMDHIISIRWAHSKDPVYPFRGPLSTSGVANFRDGEERATQAAYRIENGNVGWNWGDAAPQKTVAEIIQEKIKNNQVWFGKDLRDAVENDVTRQMSFQGEPEALPLPGSRVTLGDKKDPLGIPRPNLHYEISDYTKQGFIHVGKLQELILEKMGADPATIKKTVIGPAAAAKFGERGEPMFTVTLNPPDQQELDQRTVPEALRDQLEGNGVTLSDQLVIVPEGLSEVDPTTGEDVIVYKDWVIEDQGAERAFMVVPHDGESEFLVCAAIVHEYGGAGHIVGTYRMGDDPTDSVCDKDGRSHDHKNLFLQGAGVFPSIATANPTLTIMALALRAADTITRELMPPGD